MSVIYNEIYKIVQSIPRGKVLTYGLISHMIGGRMSAQGVGWALKALGNAKKLKKPKDQPKGSAKKVRAAHDLVETVKAGRAAEHSDDNVVIFAMETVPWQRVVNAQGGTSTHKVAGVPPDLQRHLLEAEGIKFDREGKMDLNTYLWMEGVGYKPSIKPRSTTKRINKNERTREKR